MTWNPDIEHYVLSRGLVFVVVSVIFGGNPLELNETWTLESGPHVTAFQADASRDELRRLAEV